jgi:hypothetical protein
MKLKFSAIFAAIMVALVWRADAQLRTPTAAAQQSASARQQQAALLAEQQQEALAERQEFKAQWTQQQQGLADEKNAQLQAEARAVWDAAIKKLTDERDASIAKLNSEVKTNVDDLKAQEWILKQKATELESQRSESDKKIEHQRAKQSFMPKDLWRMLDRKVCNAKDTSWFQFTGTVLEVKPNGILIHGDFGEPVETPLGEHEYFVENFPSQIYPMADNENITYPMNFVAHYDPLSLFKYTNQTIDLTVHTIRKLNYGQIVESPPPDLVKEWLSKIVIIPDDHPQLTQQLNDNQVKQAQIESQLADIQSEFERKKEIINADCETKVKDLPNVFAMKLKEKQEAAKQATTAKAVAYNQSQADKGDAFGLQRMGERNRDGDGVPKDLVKAKDYLTKAAAAGSVEATNELAQLNSK